MDLVLTTCCLLATDLTIMIRMPVSQVARGQMRPVSLPLLLDHLYISSQSSVGGSGFMPSTWKTGDHHELSRRRYTTEY